MGTKCPSPRRSSLFALWSEIIELCPALDQTSLSAASWTVPFNKSIFDAIIKVSCHRIVWCKRYHKGCFLILCLRGLFDAVITKIVLFSYRSIVFIGLHRGYRSKSKENAAFCKEMALTCKMMLILVIDAWNDLHLQSSTALGCHHTPFLFPCQSCNGFSFLR